MVTTCTDQFYRLRDQFVALVAADAPELPAPSVAIRAEDLTDMHEGENGWIVAECYAEWITRLGGPRNIAPYLACLKAGR